MLNLLNMQQKQILNQRPHLLLSDADEELKCCREVSPEVKEELYRSWKLLHPYMFRRFDMQQQDQPGSIKFQEVRLT